MIDDTLNVLNDIEDILFPDDETDYLTIFGQLENYVAAKKFELSGSQGDCY